MRRGSFFWGLVVILAGILLLMEQFGWLRANFWALFWPLVLVMAGLWFLLGPVLFKPDTTERAVEVELEGASEAKIKFRHGAGRLHVHALPSGSANLLSGTTVGRPDVSVERGDRRAKVRISAEHAGWGFPQATTGINWNLGLNPDIPLKLDVKSGASEIDLDLENLKVVELSVDTGASSTTVTVPAAAGFSTVSIKGGMAALKVVVPQGVAVRIQLQTGMMGVQVDESRFPKSGDVYESLDYLNATNKVELRFEGGMGSVDIR